MLTGKEFIDYIRGINATTDIQQEAENLIEEYSNVENSERLVKVFLHTVVFFPGGYRLFQLHVDILTKCAKHHGKAEIMGAREITKPRDIDLFFHEGMETYEAAEEMKRLIYQDNTNSD